MRNVYSKFVDSSNELAVFLIKTETDDSYESINHF